MYLLFARTRYFEVRVGETSSRMTADTPDAAIVAYFNSHVDPQQYRDDAQAEWDAGFERFKTSTSVERFESKQGSFRNRYYVPMARVMYPNGESAEMGAGQVDAAIESAFLRERGPR